jgi:hypothetical protein
VTIDSWSEGPPIIELLGEPGLLPGKGREPRAEEKNEKGSEKRSEREMK